jgi:hypothetical protein
MRSIATLGESRRSQSECFTRSIPYLMQGFQYPFDNQASIAYVEGEAKRKCPLFKGTK